MAVTTLTFLGTAAVTPAAGEDTACFLINGRVLIDCGWCATLHMQAWGYDPLAVETLIFTHCHHDHYLGLPGLLFWRAMAGRKRQPHPEGARQPLRILGPPDDLPLVVELSRRFLQAERFPVAWSEPLLHPLEPGTGFERPGEFRLESIRSRHGVTGACLRFTDTLSGVVLAFSGDTEPHPELAALARGADVLIHEASLPPEAADCAGSGHSRAADAARTALAAGVTRLYLVHLHGGHHAASLAAAREVFPGAELPREGLTITLP